MLILFVSFQTVLVCLMDSLYIFQFKKYVCDGVEDCRNGRDEDGCILNFPHTLNLTEARPAYSHTTGDSYR